MLQINDDVKVILSSPEGTVIDPPTITLNDHELNTYTYNIT